MKKNILNLFVDFRPFWVMTFWFSMLFSIYSCDFSSYFSYEKVTFYFDEKSVNWNECDKFATSNLVKEVSNLWNNGFTTKDIANSISIGQSTAARYLKKGAKFGWCDYSKQKSMERRSNGVINLLTKEIYPLLKVAAKNNNISTRTMTEYCKKHKGFMYYSDYIALQNKKEGKEDAGF